MKKLLCGLVFSVLALSAGELTGKWSGSFDITAPDGASKADTAYMDLKVLDGKVTGTAGPNADKQWPLRNGKLDGQKLTFEVQTDEAGVLVFELMFDGEVVQGTCTGTGSGGEKMSAKLHLTRTP